MTLDLPRPSPPALDGRLPPPGGLRPGLADAPALLVLALAYALVALVGLRWTVIDGGGAVLWPAAGLALAALLLGGPRLWPGVLVGRLLAAGLNASATPWWADLLVALGATLAAAAPAHAILRCGLNPRLSSLADLTRLAAIGGLGGGLISAGLGVTALYLAQPSAPVLQLFVTWTLGYAAGVLTAAPLLLSWWPAEARQASRAGWATLGLCVAAAAAVTWAVYLRPAGLVRAWHLYPVLVGAALAFNARGSSLALLVIAVGAVIAADRGLGPDAGSSRAVRLLLAQHFVLITAVTTLVLAAVADERRFARQLEEADQRNRREIAERRRAEARQQLLINELNHRLKNTLATVQSLISQAVRSAHTPEAVGEALTGRVMALSHAQDLLTRRAWEAADLGDILRAALEPFGEPGGGRVRCAGPPVALEPNLALALAMAFHELAANAARHGAMRDPAGRVTVDWQVGSPGGRLSLQWAEHGARSVGPPGRAGLGTRLLTRALPRQMHGTVSLRYDAAGLQCHMDIPLDHDRGDARD